MRRTLTDGGPGTEFWQLFLEVKRSAWRWEHQPAYFIGYEHQQFDDFIAGHPVPPTDNPDLADWMAQVAQHVSEGKTVGRVRVVDEPITEYQRWMQWMDRWNRDAGETIDYLPRARALAAGLPATGGTDWWLFDDERLALMHHDGEGRRVRVELLVDEPEVEQARQVRDLAIRTARGEADPIVVFIAQIDTGGDSWAPTVERMTSKAPTFTYDRPGTGKRPPRPEGERRVSLSVFADELVHLLDDEDITQPVVLVGHSIGALIGRVLAHRHPEMVAGMVYVDGSIPRMSFAYEKHAKTRLFDGDDPDSTEFDQLGSEVEVVNADPADVPTAVITRTPGRWPADYEAAASADPLWTAYQRQLARQCGVPLVVALDAGHQIPTDSPQLVARVVDEVVEAVRTGTPVMFDLDRLASAGGSLATP